MRFDSAAFSSESKSLSNTPLEPLPYFLGMANGRTQRGALLEFGHFENDLGRRVKARRFTYFFGQTWTVCLRKRVRRGICLAPCPNPPPRRRRPSSSIGDRGGLLGWKKDEWRKQAVGVSLPEKRPRTKDKGGRGRLGHDANRSWCQKNGQTPRVFQVQATGRFEVEDFAIHILARSAWVASRETPSGGTVEVDRKSVE